MAVTDASKIDLLYKKLFGVAKSDTSTNKSPTNEATSSPALLRGDSIYLQSSQIPATAAAVTNVVQAYTTTNRIQCTADTTTVAVSSIYPTWKTGLTDWIDPGNFGSTYLVKVYYGASGLSDPASSGGTQIFADGSGGAGEWFFDYQAGTLNFIGGTNPSGMSASSVIYIYGYRYIGVKGVYPSQSTNGGKYLTTDGTNVSWATVSGGGTTTNALTIGTGLSGTSFNGSSAVTIAIDSTVATLTGSQTLTNKSIATPFITRVDTSSEGGQIDFARASDGNQAWYIDVYGNTSTPSFRIIDVNNASPVRMQFDGNGDISANGRLLLPATTTSYSSLRLPHGTAPTSPVNGDVWTTTSGMYVRINGSTVGPLGSGGGGGGGTTTNALTIGTGLSGGAYSTFDGSAAVTITNAGVLSVNGNTGTITNIAVTNASNTISGTETAQAFIPTSSSSPSNGMFLPAANTLGFATNSAEQVRIDSSGDLIEIVNSSNTAANIKFGDGTTTYANVQGNRLSSTTGSLVLQTLNAGTLTTALTIDNTSKATFASAPAVTGGTSSGFLKADGSIDTTTYATTSVSAGEPILSALIFR